MEQIMMYSLAITVVFVLFKFVEMRFASDDDKKPLKVLFREALMVFITSTLGIYLYSQFDIKISEKRTPDAFVDNPGF
jgi:hypothetical protein